MKYISTRGEAAKLGFEEVLFAGMASDGGLYVPEEILKFSPAQIAGFAGLSYAELAFEIINPFIGGEIPEKKLKEIIAETYKVFRHPAVAPLKQLDENEWLLELFHGPTLAFKDFALQLLGRLLDYFLEKRKEKIVILGATSGDTGSAAINGCKNCRNAEIFILHPHGKTSEIQRRQMTTVAAKNVHNIAVKGTFDDCQDIVKSLFAQRDFLKNRRLVAVNSINWARVMAQIVYYFSAAVALGSPAKSVSFSVPTGNFGDIFAGFMAYKMGLPITKLIIATNENDILARFINANDYAKKSVRTTLSPSMDIQVSSNFERLLFFAHDGDGREVSRLMADFKKTGRLKVAPQVLGEIRKIFSGHSADDVETREVIKKIHDVTGEIADPHTAVGLSAAGKFKEKSTPMITLATAHPAKFPEAIKKAGVLMAGNPLANLSRKKEKLVILPNSAEKLRGFIVENI